MQASFASSAAALGGSYVKAVLSRTGSRIIQGSASASASASRGTGMNVHPLVPLKAWSERQRGNQLHRLLTGEAAAALASTRHRQSQAVARLYARYKLDAILLSSLGAGFGMSSGSTTDCEQGTSSAHSKPEEWASSVDLMHEKKMLGERMDVMLDSNSSRAGRWWAAAERIVTLTMLVAPLTLLVPLSYVSPKLENQMWKYTTWGIEAAGPTYIKLIQWATSRQDLFPAEWCSHLQTLQDQTRGHSWKETQRALEYAYGTSLPLEFDSKTPIGSGCIAQVYKAKLTQATPLFPKGTMVAVKVQHPGILEKVCVDFYLLSTCAKVLEWIPGLNLGYLSLSDSVQQFKDVMLPQLDLRVEARNLTRFRRDFKDHDQISFPHPLTHLTSRQVLVESFCHGDPILTYLKPSYSTADRQELATIGLEATMKMIFLHDFVHGDLHPGNILVERKPPASKKARLVMHLIDCGLVVEMGERDHVNLVQILGSLIKKDGKEAARLMMDTSRKCLATDMDRTLFMTGIQQICFDDEDNNFLEKVGDYLADICYLACKHKVKLEASFINAALACEIMEGIASALYPEMEVQKIALPMVMKAEVMHNLKRVTLPKFPNFGTS